MDSFLTTAFWVVIILAYSTAVFVVIGVGLHFLVQSL